MKAHYIGNEHNNQRHWTVSRIRETWRLERESGRKIYVYVYADGRRTAIWDCGRHADYETVSGDVDAIMSAGICAGAWVVA